MDFRMDLTNLLKNIKSNKDKEYFNQYCTNHYHTKKELYREWNKNKYQCD